MKTKLFRLTLYGLIMYLIGSTLNPAVAAPPSEENDVHFCGFDHWQRDNHRYARTFAANLNVGEPRTVRLIYFLPNDRSYHAGTVQQMKNKIRTIQAFYAEQMKAHGYGFVTFHVETDPQGEPVVHRVDGGHPESHYLNDTTNTVVSEIELVFDLDANIYLIVVDNSSGSIGLSAGRLGGIGIRRGKNGGVAMVPAPFKYDESGDSTHIIAHELGHAFGLYHDFNKPVYLMSYGLQPHSRLSACHAEFLAVHSYFNPDVEAQDAPPPTIEFISPRTYPAGSTSVSVQIKLSDPDGLHQVFLLRNGYFEVWGCRALAGKNDAIVEFNYDGYSGEGGDWDDVIGLTDSDKHFLTAMAVDTAGNVSSESFELTETESTHPRPQTLVKISGDNQQGPTDAQLAQPLVVEVRDQNNTPLPNVQVTFAVIAGAGKLSGRFTLENTMTDANGRAEKTLTVGAGGSFVEVTVLGITQKRVVFNAIGIGAPTVSIMNGDYQKWSLPDGATIRLGKGRIGKSDRAVTFSPDGQLLAVASGIGVWLYDVATSRELVLLPSDRLVHSVAFSPDGKTLAAGLHDGVVLWDIAMQTQIANLAEGYEDYIVGITSVSFSSDGGTIAFRSLLGDTVNLWYAAMGKVVTLGDRYRGEREGTHLTERFLMARYRPQPVAFSPDGRLLASGLIDGTVELWDVATQTLLAALSGHRLMVTSVAFSPDGRLLASGSTDETVKLWNVMKKEHIATFTGHIRAVTSVAFSPDGKTLASGGYKTYQYEGYISGLDGTIKLWDVATGYNINTFGPFQGGVRTVSFSPDGRTLASGSNDTSVKLWDVAAGTSIASQFSYGCNNMVNSVSFSPDGTILASGDHGGVLLWTTATGTQVSTPFGYASFVNSVSFSPNPNDSLLAFGSNFGVKLWDIAAHTPIATLEEASQIVSVSFSPDGSVLAAAAAGYVPGTLWNVLTRKKIGVLEAKELYMTSLSFSPDGTFLASGNLDGTIKLWDVATQTLLASLEGHIGRGLTPDSGRKGVASLSFSDDMFLASGCPVDGTVLLWDLSESTLSSPELSSPELVDKIIPDPNLLAAIRTAFGLESGDSISPTEIATLTRLEARDMKISNLTGLEFATQLTSLNLQVNSISDISAVSGLTQLTSLDLQVNSISDISAVSGLTQLTSLLLFANLISDISAVSGLTNLTWLYLADNSISDISAVSGLTNLTWLNLSDNSISDISAVSGLTQLTSLNLEDNSISDISAVSGLTQLTSLNLEDNSISDISAVSGLTQLKSLYLEDNSISDISAVSGLTQLTSLNLYYNSISDISPLVANMGLGDEDTVDVRVNPLSYLSINTHIPALQNRGVTVEFDDRAHPALLKISGDNQTGTFSASLSQPFVVEVQDEIGSVLVGVSVTFTVTAGGGTLSVTSTTTDENGRAQSTLTLGPNPGTNTVSVSAIGIQGLITFHAISEPPPIAADVNNDGVVDIQDLVYVASRLGNEGADLAADVNGDGVVDVQDLVLVAGMFGDAAAAPSAHAHRIAAELPLLRAADVRAWLTQAHQLGLTDATSQRGVLFLEQLLSVLTPKEMALLPNYPNPFNPETWIPYHLANDADVTLTIYNTSGATVRQLDLGHQPAGFYTHRSHAAYWDGRNERGESVASGVYFYQLRAGDYTALRQMAIVK